MSAILALIALVARPAVDLKLVAPHRVFATSEQVMLQAFATNRTKTRIQLVTQQDGMNWRYKAPYCFLEARKPDGTWVPVIQTLSLHCGNTNPLKSEDFVAIEPGKQGEILRGMLWSRYDVDECLRTPGKYRLRLRYDSRPAFEYWLGGPVDSDQLEDQIAQVRPLYEQTPKGEFLSNEVTIEVRA